MNQQQATTDRGDQVWGGDWQERLLLAIRKQGQNSITDFLAAHPCEPYVKLAASLGPNLAALQLVWAQFQEAVSLGQIRSAAQDCLAREIKAHLKRGWGKGMRSDFHIAGIFADWVTEVTRFTPDVRAQADAVWRELTAYSPPEGWLPQSPSDPHIERAFSVGWPA